MLVVSRLIVNLVVYDITENMFVVLSSLVFLYKLFLKRAIMIHWHLTCLLNFPSFHLFRGSRCQQTSRSFDQRHPPSRPLFRFKSAIFSFFHTDYCTISFNSAVTHHALVTHLSPRIVTLILARCRKVLAKSKLLKKNFGKNEIFIFFNYTSLVLVQCSMNIINCY